MVTLIRRKKGGLYERTRKNATNGLTINGEGLAIRKKRIIHKLLLACG
jgi:hypothetical protein